MEMSRGLVSVGVSRQFVPAFSAGLSFGYDYQNWRFASPTALGGQSPWQDLEQQSISLRLSLALSKTVVTGLQPFVEWASETGVSRADALTYGGLVSVLKVFSPKFILGGGARVYRHFYRVRTTPFVILNWEISKRFRIANAFPAGPAGGGGIEFRYTPGPQYEFAIGGVLRTDRFRLADPGPFPGQVGEVHTVPLFLRASRNLGTKLRVDLYGAGMFDGNIAVTNDNGDKLAEDDYQTVPTVAVSLVGKF